MKLLVKNRLPRAMSKYSRMTVIQIAIERLSNYTFTSTDMKLDKWLRTNIKKSLSELVIHLIRNCTVQFNLFDEFSIVFYNYEDNKLAHLITYGNMEVQGSNILKILFKR